MKTKALILSSALTVASIIVPTAAMAHDFFSGTFSGYGIQSTIDLNGDGIPGRQFSLEVTERRSFSTLEGLTDTTLISLPPSPGCSDPNAYELAVVGTSIFRHRSGNAIFAEADSSLHICFVAGEPETLSYDITGGFGIFEGATGTIDATLQDVTLITDPLTGFPQYVYSTGSYVINLD